MNVHYVLNCEFKSSMDKEILKVINQDPWLKLHALLREGYLSGRSIRSMALEYGCAYNTASKYAKGLAVPWERKRRVRTRTVLTPQLVARIGELLRGGEHSGRRRLTARRIHALLREEGLTASYSSVHQEVRRQKTALEAQGFIPLNYAPGEKLQVDFGE